MSLQLPLTVKSVLLTIVYRTVSVTLQVSVDLFVFLPYFPTSSLTSKPTIDGSTLSPSILSLTRTTPLSHTTLSSYGSWWETQSGVTLFSSFLTYCRKCFHPPSYYIKLLYLQFLPLFKFLFDFPVYTTLYKFLLLLIHIKKVKQSTS